MTDFLKIAKFIVVHFAHICAYDIETVNDTLAYCKKIYINRNAPINVKPHSPPLGQGMGQGGD